jgi:hypothetical protein
MTGDILGVGENPSMVYTKTLVDFRDEPIRKIADY